MSDSTKAVFLSFASQAAEAARGMRWVDPAWDNMRDDPAFKALRVDPKNPAPF